MTALAQRALGFPARARDRHGRARSTRRGSAPPSPRGSTCRASQVEALTLGSHGETMVPVPRLSTVNGQRAAPSCCPEAEIERWSSARARAAPRSCGCWSAAPRGGRRAPRSSTWCGRSCATSAACCRSARCAAASSASRNTYVGVPARLGARRRGRDRRPGPGGRPRSRACAAAAEQIAGARRPTSTRCSARIPAPPPPLRGGGGPAEVGVRDLRLESRIRAEARRRAGARGRLHRLDDVVAAALRRAR